MIDTPLTADMLIALISAQSPKLAEVFNAHGMACIGCVFSRYHTLAEAAAIYGIEVDVLLRELVIRRDAEQGSAAE